MSFKRKLVTKTGGFALRSAKKAYRRYQQGSIKRAYDVWARQNEEQCFVDINELSEKKHPLISIVVPVFNPAPQHFLEMVYSIVNQHYENWELVLVNASTNPTSRDQVDRSVEIDDRIKVVNLQKNLGISNNTNFGLEHCSGEYIAFFDHDDLLHRCALHTMASVIEKEQADIVYSDEDKINADSDMFFDILCKPKWSPHLLRCVNYINHLTIIKAGYVRKVGGLRSENDGAQDYDLLLRVIDACKPHIVHVPLVLYHWRAVSTSTAADFSTKQYVLRAGERALQEHLDRNEVAGKAEAMADRPGFYTIKYAPPKELSIVVGMVSRDKQRLCIEWLRELIMEVRKDFPKVEIIIGDWFGPLCSNDEVFKDFTIRLIPTDAKNYWAKAGKAVENKAVLCFVAGSSPDTKTEALARLVGCAYRNNVVAAPLVLEKSGRVLDAGLVDMAYGQEALFKGCELTEISPLGAADWVRNVSNLTMQTFASTATIFKDITKVAKGTSLTDVLKNAAFEDMQDRIVLFAHSLFTYRGELGAPIIKNKTYGNLQLQQVSAPFIRPKMSWWSDLEARSERDNA